MTDDITPIPFFNLPEKKEILTQKNLSASMGKSCQHQAEDEIKKVEEVFAAQIGAKHCLFCSSGDDVFPLALAAAGIEKGDEVITTPFASSKAASSLLQLGATVVFADIDPLTCNTDVQDIERHITKKTKAILPVHLCGYPANMDAIMHLANEHNLKVIEDCSQAYLASAGNVMVGSIGDVGCFTFYLTQDLNDDSPVGCITTNDDDLAEKCQILRQSSCLNKNKQTKDSVVCFEQAQAALLQSKLPVFEEETEARRKAAALYEEGLSGIPVGLPPTPPTGYVPSYSFYTLRTEKRDDLRAYLKERGIESAIFYPSSLYKQSAYQHLGIRREDFPETEKAAQEVLSIPLFAEITEEQIERVCNTIRDFYEQDATI